MSDLGFQQAFTKFGAKLLNPMWAVSAIAEDGSLVISCWEHLFRSGGKGVLLYEDNLSRWNENNSLGRQLLREHLQKAVSDRLNVRLVVARTVDTRVVDQGKDASKIKKSFHVRDELVGLISSFDGDNFVIEYRNAT